MEQEQLMDYASKFHGKLLLKQELQLDQPTLHLLLQEGFLVQTPGIIKKFGLLLCQRCFNNKRKYFGLLPSNHVYCRKCIMMGRVSEREHLYKWNGPQPELEKNTQPCEWGGTLTPLQQQASDQMIKQIDQSGSLLIHAVCGAGKTEMLYAGIDYAIAQGKKVCLATPRTDVVRELAPRLRKDFPRIQSAALYGDSNEVDEQAHLVIATTHQLLRYERAIDVMIVDEVDAFPYHRDPTLPKAVRRSLKKSHTLIYLTATPRTGLKAKSLLNLIPTVSIPMRFHGHPLPVPNFQHVKKIEEQIYENTLPHSIQKWIKERGNRRFLLFVPTIDMAKILSKLLDDTPYVHAESTQREELIQQFRYQKIKSLITTTILERGVTFPSIDVAVIRADHQVFDEAALVQIAGRAGRSVQDPSGNVTFFYEHKTNAMVQAKNYTLQMNYKAKKWREKSNALPHLLSRD
ncbi:DEAD/DEAH box helicase [Piscibacillus halophilus]|uniref:DEAD/DEAH box helicase n=1 Tax=Piscibacillus halophilus TaxID=571933 RepID=UPI00240A1741|nr:helicase-related protein [Piscibacillus halophilus]